MKFFKLEFISKSGYKSICIMPAVDENDARSKFLKLMKLTRNDNRPTITKIEDLGDLESKLNNFSDRINSAFSKN